MADTAGAAVEAILAPPPQYIPVANAAFAAPGLTEEETIIQLLFLIGFTDARQRDGIMADLFGSYSEIYKMLEKDITSIAEE